MADKPRKTGLGVDVFFPAPREEVKPSPLHTTQSTPEPTRMAEDEEGREMASAPAPAGPSESRHATGRSSKSEKPAEGPKLIKLTVMVSREKFDQLEELKQRERRRRRDEGGERGHNWRRQVTITQFIDEALAEFLAKKGFKKNS